MSAASAGPALIIEAARNAAVARVLAAVPDAPVSTTDGVNSVDLPVAGVYALDDTGIRPADVEGSVFWQERAGRHIAHELAIRSSLGEQQRTGLARALATRPDLAVLDEPTGHQYDANVERVLAALRERDPGTALLVATHDERVLAAADRIVHLEGGRVVA